MTRVDINKSHRVCQGDIIANVEYIEKAIEIQGELQISKIVFPYVVVLTQDCDLEQFFRTNAITNPNNNDKYLVSVIVAPLYNFEHFVTGDHLSSLGLKMQSFSRGRSPYQDIQNNKNPRYHYLNFQSDVPIPDSIIDFKHYFTVNIEFLNGLKASQHCFVVKELFREDISHRFAHFLSRIGLPDAV